MELLKLSMPPAEISSLRRKTDCHSISCIIVLVNAYLMRCKLVRCNAYSVALLRQIRFHEFHAISMPFARYRYLYYGKNDLVHGRRDSSHFSFSINCNNYYLSDARKLVESYRLKLHNNMGSFLFFFQHFDISVLFWN